MYINDYLEMINKQIEDKTQQYEFLLGDINSLYNQNKDYLTDYANAYLIEDMESLSKSADKNNQSLASLGSRGIIYKDIDSLRAKILELKKQKEEVISKALTASMLSVDEVIWILNKFGIYYKQINYGGKTLLAPLDLVLLNKTEYGKDLDLKAYRIQNKESVATANIVAKYRKDVNILATVNSNLRTLVENDVLKDIDVFIKTEDGIKVNEKAREVIPNLSELINKFKELVREKQIKIVYDTSLNNHLLDIVPAMVVNDLIGIQFYLPSLEGLKLNDKVLNVFSEEVLGFILDYIEAKYKDNDLTIRQYYANKKLNRKL